MQKFNKVCLPSHLGNNGHANHQSISQDRAKTNSKLITGTTNQTKSITPVDSSPVFKAPDSTGPLPGYDMGHRIKRGSQVQNSLCSSILTRPTSGIVYATRGASRGGKSIRMLNTARNYNKSQSNMQTGILQRQNQNWVKPFGAASSSQDFFASARHVNKTAGSSA